MNASEKAVLAVLLESRELRSAMTYGVNLEARQAFLESLSKAVAGAAAAPELEHVANCIEAELICCDVFEKRDTNSHHQICYWGGASRALVLDRANEIRDGMAS